ncbi:MAG TPA: transcription termination/antitermination protein NusA [Dehalococcoidia bacterium]|nr:transcription termination/antitermination protein NusA [Dehalococcoidia bacterium]
MKSEFLLAITQLSAEKNLSKEVVLAAVEQALASAYRKDNFAVNQNIEVKIDPDTGNVAVWAEKVAVELLSDKRREISLEEARLIKADVQLDEVVMVEATPHNAGRIAAQTAKQVILQRLHEAEHSAIFEEYADKEGDIISGVVQRIEPRQVLIDLVRTEAVLPPAEQMPNERYRVGQRLRVLLLEVMRTPKGPRVMVSRSHPDLVKRLFEMEVPEVFNGTVEIKSIAREAGHRTKVAVAARQEGIDPVGCCVGLRGIRIQNIVNELSGEKIDVVLWSPDTAAFIASALSPAQIVTVELDNEGGVATVVVPDRQLSLAIGREGQNARLSAKLAGWKIDIKPVSVYEEEKAESERLKAELAAVAKEEKEAEAELEAELEPEPEPEVKEEPVAEVAVEVEEQPAAEEEITLEVLAELEQPIPDMVEESVEEEPEPEEVEEVEPPVFFEPPVFAGKSELRFAEDILGPRAPKGKKKKKKAGRNKNQDSESQSSKRVRRLDATAGDDEL